MVATKYHLLSLVLLTTGLLQLGTASESPWRSDVHQALHDAQGKHIALLFVADSCPPCHRMLAESKESAAVRSALNKVAGIQINTGTHRVLAHRLGIQSTPCVILINRKGAIIRRIRGYQTPDSLSISLRVLTLHGDKQQGEAVRLQSLDVGAIAKQPDGTARLLELLGKDDVSQRREVQRLLIKQLENDEALWQALSHKDLGVRVDAARILSALHPHVGSSFDPFGSQSQRQQQATAWQASITEAGDDIP